MPDYFPEGNTPYAGDDELRTLQKILAAVVAGGGGGGGGGAPTDARYLTTTTNATLTAERVFTPTVGDLSATDGGAGGLYTLSLANTAVTAGTYGNTGASVAYFTVDAKGRLTSAAARTLAASDISAASGNGAIYKGSGDPNGVVTADSGALYVQIDNPGVLWVKTTDGSNTGWV